MTIRDEEEYRHAIIEIEARWDLAKRRPNLGDLTEIVLAVESYEQQHHLAEPVPSVPNVVSSETANDVMMRGLNSPLPLRAFTGWKSAIASLRACRLLFLAHTTATTFWMNKRMLGCDETPLELAEQDIGGLQMVLDHIGRIDAGVFH